MDKGGGHQVTILGNTDPATRTATFTATCDECTWVGTVDTPDHELAKREGREHMEETAT